MGISIFSHRWGRILVSAVCLSLTSLADATTIFKYRDADGVWHYTDKRPGNRESGAGEVEVLQLFGAAPEQQRTVQVEARGPEQRPQLYVVNKNLAPVEVKVWLTDTDNVKPLTPVTRIVPANSELRVADLQPQVADKPLRYRKQLRWQLGDPSAQPDQQHLYSPPLPERGTFTIAQSFDGGYSHSTPGSRYAIDIGMPIGTAVRAARGGRVVSVQDSHGGGGNSVAYRSQTNSIYVLHSDGTFGVYAHLRQRSALVRPGQSVNAGQILAQSGNTGYTTGPHLHFAVLRNAGMHWASIPFSLAGPSGPLTPTRGLVLSGVRETRLASTP